MKTKLNSRIPEVISPIIESYDKYGNGILGFTIKHTDGTFENIMQSFTVVNRDLVMAELKIEREAAIKRIINLQ